MKPRFKVRFHLAKGENYMQWQVRSISTKDVHYVDPDEFWMELDGCTLRNHPKTAVRIFSGDNKTVCAWIDCERVRIYTNKHIDKAGSDFADQLSYNPRVAPHWRDDSDSNVDNHKYDRIVSRGRALYHTV